MNIKKSLIDCLLYNTWLILPYKQPICKQRLGYVKCELTSNFGKFQISIHN